jgi:aminobenzoyl-glutamate utilization protein B
MVQTAKAMATVACEALTNQALIAAAKADHAARIGREPYRCPMPDHVAPPTNMSSG